MAKVAFWYDRPQEYSGGLNYIRNLLHAISVAGDARVQTYVFFGTKVDDAVVAQFRPLATVVRTRVLDRKSVPWFIHKVLFKLFGSLLVVNAVVARYGISIVSHAEHVYGKGRPYRLISWIPDFQYLHLPELFPTIDTGAESARLRKIIGDSDIVVLSSHDALRDFSAIAPPAMAARARVLQFVSQPGAAPASDSAATARAIAGQYGVEGKYFYLPNQFWKHKNHMVVFEAVRLLREAGREVLVVCTGNLTDYRFNTTEYIDGIERFLEQNGLKSNIKILGLVSYNEVLHMMRHAVAVINPSHFEGWSSSVEEAKSIGKKVILSNIGVHREQLPADSVYFEPDDAPALAEILGAAWDASAGGVDQQREAEARELLRQRTLDYGRAYVALVHELDRA
ncbi:MAG: glycosyltransferase [Pseudomonadota bacterium]